MARLSASERAKLPDSAFAYVDSHGERRLPINDESHVRNALSRFGQVRFETEDARETGLADSAANDLGRQHDLLEKAREIAGGLRHSPLAIEKVSF